MSEEKNLAETTARVGHNTAIPIKDPGSALTHFIAFVAILTGTPFLISHFVAKGADALSVFSVIIFAVGMALLYGASTAYHIVINDVKKRFKKFDHMMIFVLIAGSYTPFCLTILRGGCGPLLILCIWLIAMIGMIFNLCWITCPKWLSSMIYVAMGWLCIGAFPQLLHNLPKLGLALLISGGVAYTLGSVIYALKFKKLNELSPYFGSHEIFHVFVMAGSVLHFIVVYNFLV